MMFNTTRATRMVDINLLFIISVVVWYTIPKGGWRVNLHPVGAYLGSLISFTIVSSKTMISSKSFIVSTTFAPPFYVLIIPRKYVVCNSFLEII